MDDADIALRNLTYRLFVEYGRAPAVDEVAMVAGLTIDAGVAGWQRLADAHAIVLQDGVVRAEPAVHGGLVELRMANPFSAVRTPYRVHAGGRWWWANCAWDAFGICAALHVDGKIVSTCPDCDEGIEVGVSDRRPDDDALVFHCLVKAAHWWDDIVFT